jgi:hypothetical protein
MLQYTYRNGLERHEPTVRLLIHSQLGVVGCHKQLSVPRVSTALTKKCLPQLLFCCIFQTQIILKVLLEMQCLSLVVGDGNVNNKRSPYPICKNISIHFR